MNLKGPVHRCFDDPVSFRIDFFDRPPGFIKA